MMIILCGKIWIFLQFVNYNVILTCNINLFHSHPNNSFHIWLNFYLCVTVCENMILKNISSEIQIKKLKYLQFALGILDCILKYFLINFIIVLNANK